MRGLSEVTGMMEETVLRNIVRESRMVTPNNIRFVVVSSIALLIIVLSVLSFQIVIIFLTFLDLY